MPNLRDHDQGAALYMKEVKKKEAETWTSEGSVFDIPAQRGSVWED